MGNPVKDVRVALGLTQQQMADELECGLTTERGWEYDGRLPNNRGVRNRLLKLARKAGVEMDATANDKPTPR